MGHEHEHGHEDHNQKAHLKEVHDDVPPDYYDTSIKTNLIQRLYHGRRFSALCELATQTDGRLLDVGCDGGSLLEHFADKAKPSMVVALDLSAEAVRYTMSKRPDFSGLVADGEALPLRSAAFEVILCSEAMEHVERPDRLFQEIKRCLAPGGYAVVAVPNENLLYKTLWFLWTRFGKGKVWRHAHVQEFTPASLDHLIKQSGFRKLKDSYFLMRMIRAVKIAPA